MKTKLKPASRKVSAKRAVATVSTHDVVPLRNRRFKVNEC
jgi:4-alpha-glucanotransferase